jgi:DNA-binding MurR/RpiR family transcriptional regulator
MRVTEYINRHPGEIIKHSIHRVARQAGVSVATVSRLASALGYKDWKEVRLALADESEPIDNPVLADITGDDTDSEAARKVFENNIVSLRDTIGQIDARDLTRIAEAIIKSDRVVFFGSGGSGYLARDEALRFSHLELAAEAYSEEFPMILQASRMRKGQIAFGFSNSGRSRATVGALEEARGNKALTVGVANYRNTPLEKVSDIFFCTSFPNRGGITAALTARIAASCVMDAVYVLAARHGRITTRKVDYLDKILEERLRIPSKTKRRAAGK